MQREEKGRTGDERYRLKTVKSGSTVSSVQPVKRVSLSLSLFLSLFSNVASLCPTSPLDAQSDKRRIPAREKRARRTAWRIAAAVRSPGWFVNRPIAMTTMCVYVCVCVRVCVCVCAGCKRCRKNREICFVQERHLVASWHACTCGWRKKASLSAPGENDLATEQRETIAPGTEGGNVFRRIALFETMVRRSRGELVPAIGTHERRSTDVAIIN